MLRISSLAIITLLAVLLAACGGGGGNGQPNPQPSYPDPVEEVGNSDLAAAGIPDPASLAGSASRTPSLGLLADYSRERRVQPDDILLSKNILLGNGDGTLTVDLPESEQNRRIIAWGIWQMPGSFPFDHLAWLENHFSADGNVRAFFALANAGTGNWEIGGRIFSDGFESRHFFPDGSSNTLLTPNFRRSFSQSQDYIWPDGSAYVLLAIGHPGDGSANNITMEMDAWEFHTIDGSIEEMYEDGENGSCAWNFIEGGGLWNDSGIFNYIEDGELYRQDFLFDDTQGSEHILFAQPFNIMPDGEGREPTTALNMLNAADYTVWRHGFFNPGEMNGWQHPFTLHRVGGIDEDLNAAPLLDLPGGGRGIIGILVGFQQQPVSDAEVFLSPQSGGEQISTSTDSAGVFILPQLEQGNYLLSASWTAVGQQRGVQYVIALDTEAGMYRIR